MAPAREPLVGIEAVIEKYSTAFMTCATERRRTVFIEVDGGADVTIC